MSSEPKTSIVLELQREATRSDADVAELLRKAYLVSCKLDLDDFQRWAKHELDGS